MASGALSASSESVPVVRGSLCGGDIAGSWATLESATGGGHARPATMPPPRQLRAYTVQEPPDEAPWRHAQQLQLQQLQYARHSLSMGDAGRVAPWPVPPSLPPPAPRRLLLGDDDGEHADPVRASQAAALAAARSRAGAPPA